ncbi:MAG: murein hydrolase activator EnvC family protein [Lepagella sp.]
MSRNLLIYLVILAVTALVPLPETYARTSKSKSKTTTATTSKSSSKKSSSSSKKSSGKSSSKSSSKKSSTKKSSSKRSSGKSKKSGNSKPETSAEMKQREESTRREIAQTKEEIRKNDAEVKKNLSELNRLEGDIAVGKKKVEESGRRVSVLQSRIDQLSANIAAEEEQLSHLRAEYLKTVKKMRTKRKSMSTLAFIFSAKSFNEGLRRMRYLKEFGDWRDRCSADINKRVAKLRKESQELSQTKDMHSRALAADMKAQQALQSQYDRQDALVVELKKNGDALRSHLAKKQAEANSLKSRISALIAEEQRRAQAEQRAREKEQAEAERREREAREQEERRQAELLAEQNKAEQEKKQEKKDQKKQDQKKSDSKKQNQKKQTTKTSDKNSSKGDLAKNDDKDVSYAEARRRKPRNQDKSKPSASSSSSGGSSVSKPSAGKSSQGGSDFASMKGALPRPVSGAFRVVSHFGLNTLPDLPNVTYDNPGIDAEVANGATAQAVYAGKVSGVYKIPGYSTVVIVSHGDYYTVYGNIASTSVKVGDSVKQGQALGSVGRSEDDPSRSSIHFEVWKNREKLDPQGWIR